MPNNQDTDLSTRSPQAEADPRLADGHTMPLRRGSSVSASSRSATTQKRDFSPMTPGKVLLDAAVEVWRADSDMSDSEDEECGDDDTNADPYKGETEEARVNAETELPRDPQGSNSEEEQAGIEDEATYKHREIRQTKQSENETLEPHPSDPNLVLATFSYKHPDGRDMVQIDEIPDIPLRLIEGQKLQQEIWPEPTSRKVPNRGRAKRGATPPLWILDSTRDCWTRTLVTKGSIEVQEFRVQVVFRRCDPMTYEYVNVYANVERLVDADPNSKVWKDRYNKWIDQINRRNNTGFVRAVARDHWTASELRALLAGVNAYCHTKGIDRFGTTGAPMADADFQHIADRVNAVGEPGRRNVDSVRSQINTAHGKKMSMLVEIRELAEKMRHYIKAGQQDGEMADAERRPLHAIPLSHFPQDPIPKTVIGKDRKESGGDSSQKPASKYADLTKRRRQSSQICSNDAKEVNEPSPVKRARTSSAGPSSRSKGAGKADSPSEAFPLDADNSDGTDEDGYQTTAEAPKYEGKGKDKA
ncbi:hypothetical protein NX059_007718 [Plenodomus lindquistii]|nr:hypothetical protein NX059_007718 [Plenodomus lindquistii]